MTGARAFLLLVLALVVTPQALAQWSAEPGETRRNAFGPQSGDEPSRCRGACGVDCPATCTETVSYECQDESLMRRIKTYECGTHLGCRVHDDCLDACSQSGRAKLECQTKCHEEAVERFGLEDAISWASGKGPHDASPIRYEYTRTAPSAPEPLFHCPEGARLVCAGAVGRCVTAGHSTVDPIFHAYSTSGSGGMRVAGFRAGRLCGDRVCEQTTAIHVSGEDSCKRAGQTVSCTRYGMEFDYRGADPSIPLECRTTTTGGKKDFVGDLLVKGLEALPDLEVEAGEDEPHGMRVLLDVFKKVVTSADSPEDVRVTVTPLGPDGRPIESERVGTTADEEPQSAPRIVKLTASSGRLVVPMYQVADDAAAGPMTREIRCSHKGVPVIETTFHLHF